MNSLFYVNLTLKNGCCNHSKPSIFKYNAIPTSRHAWVIRVVSSNISNLVQVHAGKKSNLVQVILLKLIPRVQSTNTARQDNNKQKRDGPLWCADMGWEQ